MARRLPKYVVWNANSLVLEDYTSRREQKRAYYPQEGDRIGRIVWEPVKRKKKS